MSDNNVSMPAEYFLDLQEAAMEPSTTSERIASTVQTTALFAAMAGASTAGFYGYFKLADWYNQRKHDRAMERLNDKNSDK